MRDDLLRGASAQVCAKLSPRRKQSSTAATVSDLFEQDENTVQSSSSGTAGRDRRASSTTCSDSTSSPDTRLPPLTELWSDKDKIPDPDWNVGTRASLAENLEIGAEEQRRTAKVSFSDWLATKSSSPERSPTVSDIDAAASHTRKTAAVEFVLRIAFHLGLL